MSLKFLIDSRLLQAPVLPMRDHSTGSLLNTLLVLKKHYYFLSEVEVRRQNLPCSELVMGNLDSFLPTNTPLPPPTMG